MPNLNPARQPLTGPIPPPAHGPAAPRLLPLILLLLWVLLTAAPCTPGSYASPQGSAPTCDTRDKGATPYRGRVSVTKASPAEAEARASCVAAPAGWRGLRPRLGGSMGPSPKASQHGATRSALASFSTVSRRGMKAPFSIRRTVGLDVSAALASPRPLSPASVRAEARRWLMAAQRRPSAVSAGSSTPKASQHGETPSRAASRSIVSTPGTRPRSRLATALSESPASRESRVPVSPAALRALLSLSGKVTCAGRFWPRTTPLRSTQAASALNWEKFSQ